MTYNVRNGARALGGGGALAALARRRDWRSGPAELVAPARPSERVIPPSAATKSYNVRNGGGRLAWVCFGHIAMAVPGRWTRGSVGAIPAAPCCGDGRNKSGHDVERPHGPTKMILAGWRGFGFGRTGGAGRRALGPKELTLGPAELAAPVRPSQRPIPPSVATMTYNVRTAPHRGAASPPQPGVAAPPDPSPAPPTLDPVPFLGGRGRGALEPGDRTTAPPPTQEPPGIQGPVALGRGGRGTASPGFRGCAAAGASVLPRGP
jgi:hypothetical protein